MSLNYNNILKKNNFESKNPISNDEYSIYPNIEIEQLENEDIIEKVFESNQINYLNIKDENIFKKINKKYTNNKVLKYNYFENKQINYNDSLKMTIWNRFKQKHPFSKCGSGKGKIEIS